MEQLIIITDPNKDPDDLLTFVICALLQKRHVIDIKGIISTDGDFKTCKHRILCTKGAFLSLDLDIPIDAGIDYPYKSIEQAKHDNHVSKAHKSLTRFVHKPKTGIEENRTKLLIRLLKEAPEKSLKEKICIH